MSDDQQETEVFDMASGDICVWVDGGIHLKIRGGQVRTLLNSVRKRHWNWANFCFAWLYSSAANGQKRTFNAAT